MVRIVVAFGMAGLATLSFLALASYFPEDPGYYVSTSAKAHNWLGGPGAFLADILRKTFGIASFYVPVFIGVWAVRLLLAWSPGLVLQRWLIAAPALLALSAFASSHAAEAVSGGGLGGIVGDYLFSVLGKGAPIDSDRARLIVGAVLSLALSASLALWSIGARHRDAAALVGRAWDQLVAIAIWAFDRGDRATTGIRRRGGFGWAGRLAAAATLGGVGLRTAAAGAPAAERWDEDRNADFLERDARERDDWETGSLREPAGEAPATDGAPAGSAEPRWVGRLTERFRRRAPMQEPEMSSLSVPRAPRGDAFDAMPDFSNAAPRAAAAPERAGSSFSALDDDESGPKTPTRRTRFGDLLDNPFEAEFGRAEPGFASDAESREGALDADAWLSETAQGDALTDDDAPDAAPTAEEATETAPRRAETPSAAAPSAPATPAAAARDPHQQHIDAALESEVAKFEAEAIETGTVQGDLFDARQADADARAAEEPMVLDTLADQVGRIAMPAVAVAGGGRAAAVAYDSPAPEPRPAPRPGRPSGSRPSDPVPSESRAPEPRPAPVLPSVGLLSDDHAGAALAMSEQSLAEQADRLQAVLTEYGVRGEIIDVHPGPVVSQFELEPAPGLKAARVVGLADDIARSMSASSARVARIPGRNTIGIELPNEEREIVSLRGLVEDPSYRDGGHALPLALGRDIAGAPFTADLAAMPHLLIGGATGSGKSVAINTMLLSLLYARTPEETRLILIDPKMLELSVYNNVPHLLAPVVTEPKKAVAALKWVVREMEERYQKMARLNVRSLDSYNQKAREAQAQGAPIERKVQTGFDDATGEPIYERQEIAAEPMPYIVVVIDEMADLMMVAGKEIEHCVQRLAQMARASGIHLIMATQRPSVDVITGVIKANFPIRISFQVTSKFDSRTILGESGAEQLLGKGDMLFTAGGGRLQRLHGPFVSDEEVESVVAELRRAGGGPREHVDFEAPEPSLLEQAGAADAVADDGSDESLYVKAVDIVARERRASTSFVQRRLQIGYNRAARLVEMMEEAGVVSPANRVGKREVLIGEPS